ncbi:hypothetical protein ABNQ39_22590 [Azospirillum sp. A26]|uniref:hypothetical protein n=1 Tax=Azospirillum sp. A26 TaxID=3160607 RepID=UPI0036727C40
MPAAIIFFAHPMMCAVEFSREEVSQKGEFWERLQTAGKPGKAALIATARKLLFTLNAVIAMGTDYQLREAA